MRRIQRLATTRDVGRLLLARISFTVTYVKLHGVTCNRLATNALLDVEEHLSTVLPGKQATSDGQHKSVAQKEVELPVLHGDETIALGAKILHFPSVGSSALHRSCEAWTCPGVRSSLRAALDILGLHLLWVVFPGQVHPTAEQKQAGDNNLSQV